MRDYFKHIGLKYNTETCRAMKEYSNGMKKLTKLEGRLRFLLSCRSYGIIPNHTRNVTKQIKILFSSKILTGKLNKTEHNFHRKILNLEISETNIKLKQTSKKIFTLCTNLKAMVSYTDYISFINRQKDRINYIRGNTNRTQQAKLDTLKEIQFAKLGLVYNDDWFENMTNYEVPKECMWLLSLGKKFALPIDNNNFSIIRVIADIEQYIQTVENNVQKDIARTKVANKISQFKRKITNTQRERFILKVFEVTKKFLRAHDDIVITQADKGNKTVMMYKQDYKDKMEKLLEDGQTYRRIRTDPTMKLQKENNKIITDMHKSGLIGTWQKQKLLSSSAIAPRIYGLPKIHKDGIPLRPIISSTNVPCYALSKYIGKILKNIVSSEYNLKNSMQLKEQLKDKIINKGEILVSFDVISLFTNIPVHLGIKNVMDKWDIIAENTKLTRTTFLKILRFCLNDNSYFIHDDKIYNQIYGMPMGNPLSPTIADIVLDNLLDDAKKRLNNMGINVKYIAKYVDDFIAIIKEEDKDTILSTLNDYHKRIKFTMETENNNKISYLDATLHKTERKIRFDWYSKETASGRIMNFYTTQPKNQIINTAKSFIKRVLNISDEPFHGKNKKIIEGILRKNSFPKKLINNLIDEIEQKIKNREKKSDQCKNDEKNFYSVSYIPHLTDNKNLRKTITPKNAIFAYKPNTTIKSIFTKTKTRIDKKQQSNVVYEIKCNGKNEENCNLIYIGTTKRSLDTRIGEHKMDITKQKETTALAQHVLHTGHSVDFDNVKILDIEANERKRYTLETLRIQQRIERTLNLKEDTADINLNYKVALN